MVRNRWPKYIVIIVLIALVVSGVFIISRDLFRQNSGASVKNRAAEITSKSTVSEVDHNDTDDYIDIMYSRDDIEASVNGLGAWESDYDMAVKGDKSFTWGYIDMDFEDVYTTKIRNSFTYYCSLYFPNVTVVEGDGDMDANTQLLLCKNYVSQGLDCIIMNAVDADQCIEAVEFCNNSGIPLVLINSIVHTYLLDNGIGYVGCDNYYAGQQQAEWIIDNIDDSETVYMCYQRGTEGYDHTNLREMGVFETLDNAKFNYELLSVLISDYMRDKAYKNAQDWIDAYGDQITVIPCCNDESAMGTLEAYQKAGLIDNVSICGIDSNQDALEEVKRGNMKCTVFQNGLAQAKWAAASAYDACINNSIETKGVDCPFELVDLSNIDDYL